MVADAAPADAPTDVPPEVEALLSAPSEPSDYLDEERCLPLNRIRNVTALDDRHVLFRLSRKELYLVQLKHRCPGLRRNETVAYETLMGMSICAHDAIHGLFSYGVGDSRLGPPCPVPGFQQITEEQLAVIKVALRQQ